VTDGLDAARAGALSGKVAIVTGGASGIGHAVVCRFLQVGARVVIADIDEERGRALAGECGADARFQRTDVSEPDQISRLIAVAVEEMGDLHIMVNNAGISSPVHKSFLHDDLADFDRVMSVNLLGVMVGTRESARHMAQAGGGSIINISSVGGIQAGGGVMTYRASKAAVLFFTKCAAIEFARYEIRVNCIAPGSIPTPLLAASTTMMSQAEADAYVASAREAMRDARPLPREGTPEDVAEAAVYLAGDHSAYVTGVTLPVDGGTVAGKPIRRRRRPEEVGTAAVNRSSTHMQI